MNLVPSGNKGKTTSHELSHITHYQYYMCSGISVVFTITKTKTPFSKVQNDLYS